MSDGIAKASERARRAIQSRPSHPSVPSPIAGSQIRPWQVGTSACGCGRLGLGFCLRAGDLDLRVRALGLRSGAWDFGVRIPTLTRGMRPPVLDLWDAGSGPRMSRLAQRALLR